MKPRICAAITDANLKAIREVEGLVDLFEVRIDLIGAGWPEVARSLAKPWIACARLKAEGGNWQGSDGDRIAALERAADMGASIIDLELATANLASARRIVKKPSTRLLLSFHDIRSTPSLEDLKGIAREELAAGADIAKVVTTAASFADNLTTLELIHAFPGLNVISFAMGPLGTPSRILSPLAGGYLTYASIAVNKESAPGQLTAAELQRIYELIK